MSKKVLIAEDTTDSREMLKFLLEVDGYDVVEAQDGFEAVEKAVEEKPDLILMDVAMPVLDGLQAVEAIRQHEDLRRTPVIAVTAFGDFYKERACKAGCNAVIQKPVEFDQLQPLVRKFTGH
jgi:two-component system cell cycle response regulator DivK